MTQNRYEKIANLFYEAQGYVMLLVSATVRESAIHGLGCFTNERIKRGAVVWVYDESIDRRIQKSDVGKFPSGIQEFLRYYAYTEIYNGSEVLVLCGDHARHMNHAADPNLIEGRSKENIAVRDIEIGEELTCNYFEFDLDPPEGLT